VERGRGSALNRSPSRWARNPRALCPLVDVSGSEHLKEVVGRQHLNYRRVNLFVVHHEEPGLQLAPRDAHSVKGFTELTMEVGQTQFNLGTFHYSVKRQEATRAPRLWDNVAPVPLCKDTFDEPLIGHFEWSSATNKPHKRRNRFRKLQDDVVDRKMFRRQLELVEICRVSQTNGGVETVIHNNLQNRGGERKDIFDPLQNMVSVYSGPC
jgi:hypothetical protein